MPELWRHARFSAGLEGRQYGDTFLQASWLNRNVTILVPSGIHVLHISHARPPIPGSRHEQFRLPQSDSARRYNRQVARALGKRDTAGPLASKIPAVRDDNSTVFWNPRPEFVISVDSGAPRIRNLGKIPIP